MKCPKCGYTGFDYLDACRKCGGDLREVRMALQIIAVSPDDRGGVAGPRPPALDEPAPAADYGYRDSPAATDFTELAASSSSPEEDALLTDLNFDESFADMVEPTSYRDTAAAPAPQAGAEDDGLLDIDFGDVFAEQDKPPS